jgi:AcrR family transcriptional regulator
MIVSMRALPGRQSRASLDASPASITRSGAHADQRRRILRAVGELVGERGYGDVTVELIVKQAHVSFKTFYKHYPGKEECLLDLCESAFGSTESMIRERLAAEPAAWPERVALALRILFEQIAAEPVTARAVIVESPTVGPAIAARYERATRALVPLFRAGREFNPRGSELPERIEDTLAGSIFWSAYQRLIVGEGDQLAASLPVLTELVLRTYLGQAEASRIARAGDRDLQPALA